MALTTSSIAYEQEAQSPDEDRNIQIWLQRARAYKTQADRSKFSDDKADYEELYQAEIEKIKARAEEYGVTPSEKDIKRWMERA